MILTLYCKVIFTWQENIKEYEHVQQLRFQSSHVTECPNRCTGVQRYSSVPGRVGQGSSCPRVTTLNLNLCIHSSTLRQKDPFLCSEKDEEASYLALVTNLRVRQGEYYCIHFSDKETEAMEGWFGQSSQAYNWVRICSQVPHSELCRTVPLPSPFYTWSTVKVTKGCNVDISIILF